VSDNDAKDLAARELSARSDGIEEAYEFFLAYAAQGLPSDSGDSSQIREYLRKFERSVAGLGPFFTDYVAAIGVDIEPFAAFIGVIDRDARDAQAAIQMVLAQRSIGSQTVDNLNANIHVRALLTDLFLIDEILKT
jgi:hypothetical protein